MTIQNALPVEQPQPPPLTPASAVSSTEFSPTNDTAPADNKKRKKKKKSTKSASSANDISPTLPRKPDPERPAVLCISRNKHWKYISSYHGPWLQLPLELLESLLVLNLDPSTLSHAKTPSQVLHASKAPSPSSYSGFNVHRTRELDGGPPDYTPPDPPRRNPNPPLSQYTATWPIQGKPTPPPIDPGVFRNITSIRRLIDEAAELSVRASSGLSTTALGSTRLGSNGVWQTAQSIGLDGSLNMGNGRNVAMSAMRIHRLRALAVQKLAAAYKADEIASSVMVMQGGSVFDDIAERVLKHDPNDVDAKYVHFFHEKIPSRANRQLAESTTTQVLDELIAVNPQHPEYYRTRGIVHCFRDEYTLAAKDFTYALKEARAVRKGRTAHRTITLSSESRGKKKKAPANGTSDPTDAVTIEGPDSEPISVHPSVSPDAPDPIEPQLLFLRGATYLQHALHLIESAILKLESVGKTGSASDGTELRLSYIANGRYGGVEIGNPDGPLGKSSGPKACAYRSVLAEETFRGNIYGLLRKCIRDHERFLAHFDTIEAPPKTNRELPLDRRVEIAFLLSEMVRPGLHGASTGLVGAEFGLPPMFTTYHPLLVESHFTILICQLMLAELPTLLTTFARAAVLVDGLEGYPIFLPPRSMAQAEFVEVLERLASGWKTGIQPHSAMRMRRHAAARAMAARYAIGVPSPVAASPSGPVTPASPGHIASASASGSAMTAPPGSIAPTSISHPLPPATMQALAARYAMGMAPPVVGSPSGPVMSAASASVTSASGSATSASPSSIASTSTLPPSSPVTASSSGPIMPGLLGSVAFTSASPSGPVVAAPGSTASTSASLSLSPSTLQAMATRYAMGMSSSPVITSPTIPAMPLSSGGIAPTSALAPGLVMSASPGTITPASAFASASMSSPLPPSTLQAMAVSSGSIATTSASTSSSVMSASPSGIISTSVSPSLSPSPVMSLPSGGIASMSAPVSGSVTTVPLGSIAPTTMSFPLSPATLAARHATGMVPSVAGSPSGPVTSAPPGSTVSASAPASGSVTSPSSGSMYASASVPVSEFASTSTSMSCPSSPPVASCSTSPPVLHAKPIKQGVDLVESLDCARMLLIPVAVRQRERATQAAQASAAASTTAASPSSTTTNGTTNGHNTANGHNAKKIPLNINIPLHGPRVEIILAWLAAVHLVELESVA